MTPSFERAEYSAEEDPRTRFLLELELTRSGPDPGPGDRVQGDILLVLDVSGSMEAADRYPLLRRAVAELLERIDPGDRVGIVLFSTGADGVTPLIPGVEARQRREALLERMDGSSLMFGGGTHLAPGLGHALEALAGDSRPEAVRRVYVLTDGALHDTETCERLLPAFRRAGIEVHVYGFGAAFDAAALKRLVSDQLGGSVKPICHQEDIVGTFSHIAEVNRRLITRDAMLELSFAEGIDCGDAFSFRPHERWLGQIRNRSLVRELGALEEGRRYALLAEVRLPPGVEGGVTPVARAELRWQKGGEVQGCAVEIAAPRGRAEAPEVDQRVEQAFRIVDALRRDGDRPAALAAARARFDLARCEGRDPGLLAALEKQIDVLEGRIDAGAVTAEDAQYLAADLRTAAGLKVREAERAEGGSAARREETASRRINMPLSEH